MSEAKRSVKGETYAEYKARQDTENAEAELWEAAADQAAAQAEAQERLKETLKQDRAATVLQSAHRKKDAKVAVAVKRAEKQEQTANEVKAGADGDAEVPANGEEEKEAEATIAAPEEENNGVNEGQADEGEETKAEDNGRPSTPPPKVVNAYTGERKLRAHALARKPSRRFTPEPVMETTVQLCRRLIAARESGEPLFEGMLPKKRMELSRYYKSGWKGRFLKVYFDKIEYGKWNKWGRYQLRRNSPLLVNHHFNVMVEGGSGTDAPTPSSPPGPRFLVVRAQRAGGSSSDTSTTAASHSATHVFLDDPEDKKKKGKSFLAVMQNLQRCQQRLYMERTVSKYLSDAVTREHRRDLKKWAREAKPLLEDGGVEGLLTPGLPELLVRAVGLVETIYVAQEAWRAKLEDVLERLLEDATPGVGDGQSLAKFSAAHRLATEGMEMNGDVVSLVDEAFDDLILMADARLARLRAEKDCSDAFASGLANDNRAALMQAATACQKLRDQSALPPALDTTAETANARIVEISVAQAKMRAELESTLTEALGGHEWEPARDALTRATDGVPMHGDVISLAKKPDLLAVGTRRVERLSEEKALMAVCVDAVVSDTRVALEAAAAACEVLANKEGEGPLTASSLLSSLSPQKGLLGQKAQKEGGSPTKDESRSRGAKAENEGGTDKEGAKGEASSSSSSSSEASIPGLPPHLLEQQARVTKRLETVRADQQAWTDEAEAGIKQLCDAEGGGGDLDAVLAAEESLLVGPDAGGTKLHGDVMSLQGRMDLLELVRTRASRLIRERDLAVNVAEAMQSGDGHAMALCVMVAKDLATKGNALNSMLNEQVDACEALVKELEANGSSFTGSQGEDAAIFAAQEAEESERFRRAAVQASAEKRLRAVAVAEATKVAKAEKEAKALAKKTEKEAKKAAAEAKARAAAAEAAQLAEEAAQRKEKETAAAMKAEAEAADAQAASEALEAEARAEAAAAAAAKAAEQAEEDDDEDDDAEKDGNGEKGDDEKPEPRREFGANDDDDDNENVAGSPAAPSRPGGSLRRKASLAEHEDSTFAASILNLPSGSDGLFGTMSGGKSNGGGASKGKSKSFSSPGKKEEAANKDAEVGLARSSASFRHEAKALSKSSSGASLTESPVNVGTRI